MLGTVAPNSKVKSVRKFTVGSVFEGLVSVGGKSLGKFKVSASIVGTDVDTLWQGLLNTLMAWLFPVIV